QAFRLRVKLPPSLKLRRTAVALAEAARPAVWADLKDPHYDRCPADLKVLTMSAVRAPTSRACQPAAATRTAECRRGGTQRAPPACRYGPQLRTRHACLPLRAPESSRDCRAGGPRRCR